MTISNEIRDSITSLRAQLNTLDSIQDEEEYRKTLTEHNRHVDWFNHTLNGILVARNFLRGLQSATFTAEDARAELEEAANRTREHEERKEDWAILPPQPTERRATESHPSQARTQEVDQERIDKLHELVDQWGEGYVVESQFKGHGTDHYYAAVLPQKTPDGTVLEHAVVDNPSTGNAIFVWRAEQGIQENEALTTWQDVFVDKFKSQAKDLGARKITHQNDWEYRMVEYLTRKEEDLSK
jgi:hypothetical protein